jgi:hypothetical protein
MGRNTLYHLTLPLTVGLGSLTKVVALVVEQKKHTGRGFLKIE